MRALAGVDAEFRQGAFHQDAGLGDVAPGHRYAQRGDAGAPSAIADEYVLPMFLEHAGVQLLELGGHFQGLHLVEGIGLEVHDVAEVAEPAGAQRAGGADDGVRAVDVGPVHLGVQAVGRYGPDLEGVEDAGGEVGGEFQLYAALHLLAADFQQLAHDGREGIGVIAENVREGHELGTLGEGRVGDALVLVIVSGTDFSEGLELAAVHDGDAFQVHGVVHGGLELFGGQVQGVHHLLGFAQGEVRGGCLQHVLGVGGGEAQDLLSVHDGLAQAVGQLDDAFLGLFIADGIEVHAAGHAGEGGEEVFLLLGAAHLLEDDGHLLFGDHVGRGGDIASGRGEIDRRVHALDGL